MARKRVKKSATSSGTFTGTQTDAAGLEHELNMLLREIVDAKAGKVSLTISGFGLNASSLQLMIQSDEYARWRLYVLFMQIEALRRERFRNEVRPPVPKPPRSGKSTVATSIQCPDCDGSGYARGGECPRCQGNCWIVIS